MPVITLPAVDEAAWGNKLNTAINAINAQVDTHTSSKLDTSAAAELIRDTMGTALVAGANVTVTVNDAGDTITIASSGGSGATWGGITGTLSSQTDLQTALNGKVSTIADPNADRIRFWDDSAGAEAYLAPSTPLTISGTSLSVNAASDTAAGIVELATTAEATTGTDTTRAVTAAGVKAVGDTKAPLSHTHNASDINAGTVATARLGSGTANSTTFLRGDNTWATPSGGGGATMLGKANWWTALPTSATWVIPGEPGSVSGTINFSSGGGAIWLRPLDIGASSTLDALGVNVGTGSADGTGHFGVWASGADGMPTGTPVWSSSFDIVTAGNKIITVSPAQSINASTRLWIGVLILGASAGTFRRHLATQTHGGDSFEHHGTDANAALGASTNAIKFPLSHTTTASSISTDLTGATRTAQVSMPLVGANVTRL